MNIFNKIRKISSRKKIRSKESEDNKTEKESNILEESNKTKYNGLQGNIRMQKIGLIEAEELVKKFKGKWIYIKLISNTWQDGEPSEAVLYSKFKVKDIVIDDYDIRVYGIEDDDRLIISKVILVQSECTHGEVKFMQKANDTLCEIYIKEYLPTANARLDEITNSRKNIIITEGKTDWKHLKNALSEFKKQNKYSNLDFEFFEYEDEVKMCNSKLLKVCEYQALFENENIKVFVLDADDPAINNKHEGKAVKYYGNNVYSLILAVPEHRSDTPLISIENYYTDDEIKIKDENGRRLYLAKEFNKETGQHLERGNIYTLNVKKDTPDNHIIDDMVYRFDSDVNMSKEDINRCKNKTNIALSKNNFAKNILNKIKPFDEISTDTFSLVFDVLTEIQKDSIKKNDTSLEISEGVYLDKYGDKGVLSINVSIKMETALEFKNTSTLYCIPTVSEDKNILKLELHIDKLCLNIPIKITNELIDFLESKLRNSSNRIEVHVYNENNEPISNKELFQGENSSPGISIILNKIFS